MVAKSNCVNFDEAIGRSLPKSRLRSVSDSDVNDGSLIAKCAAEAFPTPVLTPAPMRGAIAPRSTGSIFIDARAVASTKLPLRPASAAGESPADAPVSTVT